MHRLTIATVSPQTIDWLGDGIVDWVQRRYYNLAEPSSQQVLRSFGFSFDRAITSADGQYAFVYLMLGTKGILLKDGEELREINRIHYHAADYEYPAAFVTVDEVTYLVHCPVSYCQLDFENVETGELITNIPARKPDDIFHSRLEVSPEGGYLMSKGWLWHPWDVVKVFDIRACLDDPLLLDAGIWNSDDVLSPKVGAEICSAGFVTEHKILLASSGEDLMDEDNQALPPQHLVIWNLATHEFSKAVPVNAEFGNVFPIDEERTWDLYKYPKIINVETGEVTDKLEGLDTGQQCSSITTVAAPAIVYNRWTKQIAVKNGDDIEVLSVD